MVDLIFAVDDAFAWHQANMQMNPEHYAPCCRWLGANHIARVQSWAAGLYYNTLVPCAVTNNCNDKMHLMVKYGVISRETLLADLLDWKTM